jgi:DNA-binding PadR family transcriptional regulator
MKRYRDRVGIPVSTGNFYRELQRLVESGLARTADRSLEGDPRRAPYVITDAGREAFRRWFADVPHATLASLHEDEISDRLAFLTDVSVADVRAMLDRLQDDLWMHAKMLERSRDAAAMGRTDGTRGLPLFGLIATRRIRHVAAEVAFLAELRETFDGWAEQQAVADKTIAAGRPATRNRSDAKGQRR